MSIQLNKRSAIVNAIIKKRLENGEMPSSADIIEMIAEQSTVERSSMPAGELPDFINGDTLDATQVNALLDDVEIDLMSMRMTLDDSWMTLKTLIEKALRTMPVVEREAGLVKNMAIRALALTPTADAVRVSKDGIAISKGIGFGTIDGADMNLSSGIEIDLAAGTLILERSSVTVIPVLADENDWSVSGEYPVKTDMTIGDPTWTCDSDIAKTWTVVSSTQSQYGRVTLSTVYEIDTTKSPLKRVEVFAPDHIETTVDIYVDFDSSGQYTLWESGSGKGRILIDGETVHPERVRVDLSRYRAQSSSLIGSTPRNEYSFQVAEIVFMSSAYAEEGNVVTDPINLGNDQISSIIVDVDASSPATSSVNAYIARDVDGASSLSDFRWVQVDKNNDVSGLMTLSYEVQEIVATAPSKIRTGSGLYSNSIYSIGSVDGKIVRVDEGFNQFEVRKMSVNSNGSLPEADSLDWSRSDQSVVNSSGSSVSGANYYKLSTSIYADNESSHKIQLSLDGAESYKVKLNGTDLTTRIQDGENSASFQKGKNDLVIYLCTGEESGSVSVSIGDIAGCSMMISRPTIVQESSLNSSENRIAQSGKDLVVNHDPTGRIFRVHTERSSGTKIDTVRLRIELKRGLNGETPQVKRAFITTGV